MNCESITTLIPLYYYGELSPEEEDSVEEHTHECRDCAREIEHQRVLAGALGGREMQVPPLLLEDCRADLMAAVHGGVSRLPERPVEVKKSAWSLFLAAIGESFSNLGHFRQPIGAAALVAIGFFGARLTMNKPGSPTPAADGDVLTTVRSVQPDSAGGVQVSFDETRRRVERGRINDPRIQSLMLAGVREDNPSVRVEAVDLLKAQNGDKSDNEVRDALISAVTEDSVPAVRLKALERLKPWAGDPEVRKALSRVLITDNSVPVKMQVLDMMVAHRDDSMVGLLQGLVQRENNGSMRLKLEKALKDMNASVGTF